MNIRTSIFRIEHWDVYLEGNYIYTTRDLIKEGELFLPLQQTTEALGYTYYYNPKMETAHMDKEGEQIEIYTGTTEFQKNGKLLEGISEAFLNDGNVYSSERFFKDLFSIDVEKMIGKLYIFRRKNIKNNHFERIKIHV